MSQSNPQSPDYDPGVWFNPGTPTWTRLAEKGIAPSNAAFLMRCDVNTARHRLAESRRALAELRNRGINGTDLFRVAASEARMPVIEIADIPAGLMTTERARKMDATECAHHAAFAIENGHSHLEQAPRIANYEAR